MVTSFFLPKAYANQFNKHTEYALHCLSPPTNIGRVVPFGRIWWMRGKQKWGTTLAHVRTAYLDVRVDGRTVGVMYVENGVALKLTWKYCYDTDTPRS